MADTTEAVATDVGDQLLTRLDGGALWITLNRPTIANALSDEQRVAIVRLLATAAVDPGIRVVAIAANGRHFCGGMDMTRPAANVQTPQVRAPGSTMQTLFTDAQQLIRSVLDCPKPVVAVVQGPAAGIGLYFALACDLVVAGDQAAFVETFVSRGMALHCGGAHLLPARMGLQRAKQFVFLGERLSATEAQAVGLVNQVVPAEQLQGAAEDLVRRLAAGPTVAIGLSKRLLNRSIGSDRATSLSEEAMTMEIVGRSQDMTEGRRAFVERRSPEFVGH